MYQRQVSFGEAVNLAIAQNYCRFRGRASRSEYWYFVLFNLILNLVILALFAIAFASRTPGFGAAVTVLSYVLSIALFLPSLGLSFRRLHDTGHSGWWILINLIPIVGPIVFLVFMCKESEPEENKYGTVPNLVEA